MEMLTMPRFIYFVDRLYRAGKRFDSCATCEERELARAWMLLWNRAVKLEHQRLTKPDAPSRSDVSEDRNYYAGK